MYIISQGRRRVVNILHIYRCLQHSSHTRRAENQQLFNYVLKDIHLISSKDIYLVSMMFFATNTCAATNKTRHGADNLNNITGTYTVELFAMQTSFFIIANPILSELAMLEL